MNDTCRWTARRSKDYELNCLSVSAELHYTDTGSEHQLRTPPTNTTNGRDHKNLDVVQHVRSRLNLLYNILPATNATNGRAHNKFTTNGQKFATSQHLDMLRCWALAFRRGKFVVELLWARPLVLLYNMSVAGVRVVEFGPKPLSTLRVYRQNDVCWRRKRRGDLVSAAFVRWRYSARTVLRQCRLRSFGHWSWLRWWRHQQNRPIRVQRTISSVRFISACCWSCC